ncbi:MAG: T9SS type A sorting domain-containing protein [Bacteroidota bacterium]
MPHMHLIGKSIKAYCVTPSNDTIHLIDIPEWDFHWQYFYQFQKPILLPAGSVVYGEATYDNTTNNPNNPNNPPKDVGLGEGTEDEMFLIYTNLSSYLPGDTNIIIDTLSHYPHDASCFQTTGINTYNQSNVKIYPNPTSGVVQLEGFNSTYTTTVYTNEGKAVYTKTNEPNDPLNLQHLYKGVYYLQIKTKDNEVVYKKLILQ